MTTTAGPRGWLLVVAGALQMTVMGTAYAFPLWLITFKGDFDASQTKANTIGIVLYLSVSWLGVPCSPFVLARVPPKLVPVMVTGVASLGFTLLYLVADHKMGHSSGVFAVLLLAILLIMCMLGIWFSFSAAAMMRRHSALLVSGILSVAVAGGGALAGMLYAFSGISLAKNLLIILIVQLVAAPFVIYCIIADQNDAAAAAPPPEQHAADKALQLNKLSDGSTDLEEPLLAPGENGDQSAPAAAQDNSDNSSGGELPWGAFLSRVLSSSDYWSVILLMVLKVGIGGSFMTNLGTMLQAALPEKDSESHINSRVAVAVIIASVGQLTGRTIITVYSLYPLRGNPNNNTLATLIVVSLVYILCFVLLLAVPYTQTAILIITAIFGVSYGAMWTTSSALIPFLPVTEPVTRLLAITWPFSGIGTLTLNLVAGALYDRHVETGIVCYGRVCYRATMIIWLALSTLLFFAVLWRVFARPIPTAG